MIYAFLSTPSGAWCVLRGRDGLLYPTAWGDPEDEAHSHEWASLEIKKNTGVLVPPASFREAAPGVLIARYNVNMGPFALSPEYADEEWADAEELRTIHAHELSPELLSVLKSLSAHF